MGVPAPAIVRLDFGSRVACIQSRLDHQYLLSRYLSTAKSTQQFFTLATEHTAADNFNPASRGKEFRMDGPSEHQSLDEIAYGARSMSSTDSSVYSSPQNIRPSGQSWYR